jgi:hypothetical protein
MPRRFPITVQKVDCSELVYKEADYSTALESHIERYLREVQSVTGTGFDDFDIIENYRIIYGDRLPYEMGEIDLIKYARDSNGIERMAIGMPTWGVIDAIRENGELRFADIVGLDSMHIIVGAAILQNRIKRTDLKNIMGQISPEATDMIDDLLEYIC